AGARGPHADLRDQRRGLRGGCPRARRGLRRRAPGLHVRDHPADRPALARRDRGGGARRMKQVTPPSITGKGAGFAQGGSVLDHSFGKGDPFTLGVEEEYMLLDSETFDLVQHIDTVLAAVAGHELEERINAELMQSVIEITTPVCRTAADVERELAGLRSYVTEVARDKGLRVGSAGTHPFSLFERQRITARDRSHKPAAQIHYAAPPPPTSATPPPPP